MKEVLKQRVAKLSLDEIVEQMYTDVLTGVWNRRAFEELFADQLNTNPRMFVAIVDLDSLKYLNDNFGHRAGDDALKSVADELSEQFPGRTFRLSGDEFVVYGDHAKLLRVILDAIPQRIFSFGVGRNLEEADADLQNDKHDREKRGMRAARGVEPPKYYMRKLGFRQMLSLPNYST